MRRLLFIILLFINRLDAQSVALYNVDLIPPACLSNANSVVRSATTVFHVTGPDEAEMEETAVFTILNAKGKSFSIWYEAEDEFTEVKQLKARLYDLSGAFVRESDKSDIKEYGGGEEYEYRAAHMKVLEMPYNSYPYSIEFKSRKTIKGFFRIPEFVVQHLGQSVQRSEFQLITPPDYAIKWKMVNAQSNPVETTVGTEKLRVWSFQELPAFEDEVYNPFFMDTYSKIVLAPGKVKIDDYKGDFSNWAGIGKFFFQLNQYRNRLSEQMQTTIAHLVQDKKTNREKIETLYHYLQANYRYVSIQIGIGGWQTYDAEFVEKKKYGDCKALSNFMITMLQYAGIDAYQAILFAGDEGGPELYEDAPTPYSNHVIVYIPSENTWLECTSQSAPTGYLGRFTAGRQALLITPEGGRLIQTPDLNAAQNTRNALTIIQLNENGGGVLETQINTAFDQHDYYRALERIKNKTEIEKQLVEHVEVGIAQLQTFQLEVSPTLPEATLRYKAELSNYATRSGKRMFVPIFKSNPFKRSLPADDLRQLDLKIHTTYTLSDTIHIQYPPVYDIENVPVAKKIESEFGQYNLEIIKEPGMLTAIRHIEIPPVSVPAARYDEVRQFYQSIAKTDATQMVLVKKE
jgi:hypothetical protein